MEEKDLNIFYRPNIEIERDYRSEGVIPHKPPVGPVKEQVPEIPTEIEAAIEKATEAGQKLIRIRKITEVLPTAMKKTVDDLLDTVIIWIATEIPELEKIKEEDEEKPDDEKYEVPGRTANQGTTEPEPSDDEWPVMTSSGFVFSVIKNKDSWDLAHEQYLLDSAAIQEDFAEKYNNVMEKYVYQLVSAMDEIGLDAPEYLNYEYEGDTVTGIPANYMHLNDIIVRNQDVVNEYADIFRKTHDEYTTHAVLTAYDVASQKRIRYLKEQYKTGTAGTYIEMYDKNYLADARTQMEQRYIDARNNVYKMLNSAVKISDDMLTAQLALAVSKCSLLSKEVNIFVKKEYENVEYENSTSTGATKDLIAEAGGTQTNTQVTDTKANVDSPKTTPEKTDNAAGSAIKQVKNDISSVVKTTKDAATGAVTQIRQQGEDILADILGGIATNINAAAENTAKINKKKGQST